MKSYEVILTEEQMVHLMGVLAFTKSNDRLLQYLGKCVKHKDCAVCHGESSYDVMDCSVCFSDEDES